MVADNAVLDGFRCVRTNLVEQLSAEQQVVAGVLRSALPDWHTAGTYRNLGSRFHQETAAAAARFPAEVFGRINQMLVVDLAMALPETLSDRRVPSDVLALYPGTMLRLLTFLSGEEARTHYFYPGEYFLNDLRFAAALSIPCGAQTVDLASVIGPLGSLNLLSRPNYRYLGRFLSLRKIGAMVSQS